MFDVWFGMQIFIKILPFWSQKTKIFIDFDVFSSISESLGTYPGTTAHSIQPAAVADTAAVPGRVRELALAAAAAARVRVGAGVRAVVDLDLAIVVERGPIAAVAVELDASERHAAAAAGRAVVGWRVAAAGVVVVVWLAELVAAAGSRLAAAGRRPWKVITRTHENKQEDLGKVTGPTDGGGGRSAEAYEERCGDLQWNWDASP